MRARTVRPEFWKHEGLAEVSREIRHFYIGLWCLADSVGILEDRPKRIAAELFPYDADISGKVISEWIAVLADHGFITRYQKDGGDYIWIPKHRKHQYWSMAKDERVRKTRLPIPVGVSEEDLYKHKLNESENSTGRSTGSSTGGSTNGERVIGEEGNMDKGEEGEMVAPPLLSIVYDLGGKQELGNGTRLDGEWMKQINGLSEQEVRDIFVLIAMGGEVDIYPSAFGRYRKPYIVDKIKQRKARDAEAALRATSDAARARQAEIDALGRQNADEIKSVLNWLQSPFGADLHRRINNSPELKKKLEDSQRYPDRLHWPNLKKELPELQAAINANSKAIA